MLEVQYTKQFLKSLKSFNKNERGRIYTTIEIATQNIHIVF
jgi:mRNA-degrading endonuclease RelE of RelBE toxin-antitoxin system